MNHKLEQLFRFFDCRLFGPSFDFLLAAYSLNCYSLFLQTTPCCFFYEP